MSSKTVALPERLRFPKRFLSYGVLFVQAIRPKIEKQFAVKIQRERGSCMVCGVPSGVW